MTTPRERRNRARTFAFVLRNAVVAETEPATLRRIMHDAFAACGDPRTWSVSLGALLPVLERAYTEWLQGGTAPCVQ